MIIKYVLRYMTNIKKLHKQGQGKICVSFCEQNTSSPFLYLEKSATSLSIQRLAIFYTHYTEFFSRELMKYEDINFRNYWIIPIPSTSGGCVTSVSVLLSSFTITVTLLVLFMSNRSWCKEDLICLFVWVFRPTWEYFIHMETSPLPVKGSKFLPMLGTHGHWAMSVL